MKDGPFSKEEMKEELVETMLKAVWTHADLEHRDWIRKFMLDLLETCVEETWEELGNPETISRMSFALLFARRFNRGMVQEMLIQAQKQLKRTIH